MLEITPSKHSLNKKDIVAFVSLIIAFFGLFWAVLPMAMDKPSQKQESMEVSEAVVEIAKSFLNSANKEKKEKKPPPAEKTFLDKAIEMSFIGSLSVAFVSFVISVIVFAMGSKGRIFSAVIAVNIVTIGVHIFLIAVAIAIILLAIRFIAAVGTDFF